MDAVKFIEEHSRMCASYAICADCPLFSGGGGCIYLPSATTKRMRSKIIKSIEEWSAAHPRKTRQNVFLEQWPEATLDRHGISVICPKQLNYILSCIDENDTATPKRYKDCTACRREFWMQEVE